MISAFARAAFKVPCSRATAEIEFISEIEEIYNKRQKRQQQQL